VRTFVIKPIPTPNITPVLVFINPKSGGNQGAKLLQKFQWLLNPRQVFDLTQGGPKMGYVMSFLFLRSSSYLMYALASRQSFTPNHIKYSCHHFSFFSSNFRSQLGVVSKGAKFAYFGMRR